MVSFEGTPAEIGRAYGEQCRDGILANVRVLVLREGHEPLPRQDRGFPEWVHRQEAALTEHWPWLLEEIAGVAEGSGAGDEDVLLLNLRAWQYDCYGRPPAGSCSSLAVTLADGTVACAGALDDPAEYYCGPVRFAPRDGLAHITFPITGTSWGNRGMNSSGLAVGISSQLLPGLRSLPHAVNQDLALRAILQTCCSVGEVREFCRRHPFAMNLVCVDAQGGLFCAHQTAAGLFELPTGDGWCALTNHVADDGVMHLLSDLGAKEFPECPTTRARRGRLMEFCRECSGACAMDDVLDLIWRRDDSDPGSIHNVGTIAITLANPSADRRSFQVRQPQTMLGGGESQRLAI